MYGTLSDGSHKKKTIQKKKGLPEEDGGMPYLHYILSIFQMRNTVSVKAVCLEWYAFLFVFLFLSNTL